MRATHAIRRRGTPLAMLAILLAGWVVLRFATWETPFVFPALANSATYEIEGSVDAIQNVSKPRSQKGPAPHSVAYRPFPPGYGYAAYLNPASYAQGGYLPHVIYVTQSGQTFPGPLYGYAPYPGGGVVYPSPSAEGSRQVPFPLAPGLSRGPRGLDGRDIGTHWRLLPGANTGGVSRKREGKRYAASQDGRPPFAAPSVAPQQPSRDRWLLDAYGFYRQGSSALSVTQGRQPIYGASQIAANLQWRAKPSSSHDPRIYARAYHALVTGGESEFAAGISARPLGKIPVRLYGELRAVRNPAITDEGISSNVDLRPAAYAVTELPPQKLPFGFALEAYGAGGYVGGDASTYFLDGQAAVIRPVTRVDVPSVGSAAVSLGAGVWGGAQEGVSRVDVGPTLRFDVDIGKIPARVSVDYREQVAGDAEPDSGVAATVSTRF